MTMMASEEYLRGELSSDHFFRVSLCLIKAVQKAAKYKAIFLFFCSTTLTSTGWVRSTIIKLL